MRAFRCTAAGDAAGGRGHRAATLIHRGALLLAVVACHRDQPPPPPPPVVQLAPADLVTARVGNVESGPLISGTLEASTSATIRAQLGGTIRRIGPELGQAVARGALLAEIDAPALGDLARSARAQVAAT